MFIVSLMYKQTKTPTIEKMIVKKQMVKSKQTIEKTIKQIKSLGFDSEMYETNIETIDKYKEVEVITTMYFNEDLQLGVFINFQEVDYPTIFEVNHYTENKKTNEWDYESGTRVVSIKELKEYIVEHKEQMELHK